VSAIHILVLNYNGEALLQECLPSVLEACRHSPIPCVLSVVDNASGDGSRAWLKKALPEVGWIPRAENKILFSYNEVVAELKEDLILLLNNDIKVEEGFIAPLVEALRTRPEAFAASPRHVDFAGAYNGGMNRCGRRLSLAWAGPAYLGAEQDSQRTGETLFTGNGLFRRDKFLALGGFDSLYAPMGWEDADLCARAWTQGWPTLYVPASLIHHKSSASIAKAFSRHARRALGFRNATLWLVRNAPARELVLAFLALPLTLAACLLTGRLAQLEGLARSLPRLPRALTKRRGGEKAWWAQFSAPAYQSEASHPVHREGP
jgi:N-acetylglucosaminyl-diphospho-decaprenol L-rhamnosyltransferase